jgi:acyl-CoA dehydrogenase
MCDDFPLASMFAHVRMLQIADGPCEVHRRTVARRELAAQAALRAT